MPVLEVPYIKQFQDGACGLAAVEMVYRYFRPSRLSKFSQEKQYAKLVQAEKQSKAPVILTTTLVDLARSRGFQANWARVSPDPAALAAQLHYFIVEKKIPLIACQRPSDEGFLLGHFRVIVGIDGNEVVFHDPDPVNGGPTKRLTLLEMVHFWKRCNTAVVGGVAIWMTPEAPADNPLLDQNSAAWLTEIWVPPGVAFKFET